MAEETPPDVGRRVRMLREQRGLSLRTLAEIAKKDQNRNLVIYSERLWFHPDELKKWANENKRHVRPMLVPFGLK